MKAVDLLGERFGKLTVASTARMGDRRGWVCHCECGGTITVTTGNLRNGSYRQCGDCGHAARLSAHTQHGHNRGGQRSKEYRAWTHIVQRCRNPDDAGFHRYGGRGITVDEQWVESFDTFLAAIGPAPSAAHTVDRIDNDRGYEPGNVRWATRAQQARNTRRNVMVGELCLKDACEAPGVSYGAAQARLKRGATLDQALSPLMGSQYRAMLAAAPPSHLCRRQRGKADGRNITICRC